jgi:hypothetical protein
VTRARTFDRAGAGGGGAHASWNDNERSETQRRGATFLALIGVMPSSCFGGGGGMICIVMEALAGAAQLTVGMQHL